MAISQLINNYIPKLKLHCDGINSTNFSVTDASNNKLYTLPLYSPIINSVNTILFDTNGNGYWSSSGPTPPIGNGAYGGLYVSGVLVLPNSINQKLELKFDSMTNNLNLLLIDGMIKIVTAGNYNIMIITYISSVISNSIVTVSLLRNGVLLSGNYNLFVDNISNKITSIPLTGISTLNIGDILELVVTTTTNSITVNNTGMSIFLL